MNKLEYEMNQVALEAAEKATKETTIKVNAQNAANFVRTLKGFDISRAKVLETTLQNFGTALSREEIEKLVRENY